MGCTCMKHLAEAASPTLNTIEDIEPLGFPISILGKDISPSMTIIFPELGPIEYFSEPSVDPVIIPDSYIYSTVSLNSPNHILEYNITKHSLDQVEIPFKLYSECAVLPLNNQKLLCVGGYDLFLNQEVKNTVIVSIENSEIFELAPLLNAKRKARLIQDASFVYCIGGVREVVEKTSTYVKKYQSYEHNFERYSFENNIWESLPQMVFGVEYPACCVFAGEIFACGGANVNGKDLVVEKRIQVFNIENLAWRTCDFKLEVPMYGGHCWARTEDYFLIFGGCDGSFDQKAACYKFTKAGCEVVKETEDVNLFSPYYFVSYEDEIYLINDEGQLVSISFERKAHMIINLESSKYFN